MGYPAVERRRSQRVRFDRQILVRFGAHELICKANDLSMGGILICAPVKLDEIVAIRLKFIVPNSSSNTKHAVDSDGMVVHRSAGPGTTTILGVEFFQLTNNEVRGIAQFAKDRRRATRLLRRTV